MNHSGLKIRKSSTYTHTYTYAHTYTHIHTSGRQLKIIILDILDHSEYSDTNISNLYLPRKHS